MSHPNQLGLWIIADAVDTCSNDNDPVLEQAFEKLRDGITLTAVEYVDLRRAVLTALEGEEREIAKAMLAGEWDRMAATPTPSLRERPNLSEPALGL